VRWAAAAASHRSSRSSARSMSIRPVDAPKVSPVSNSGGRGKRISGRTASRREAIQRRPSFAAASTPQTGADAHSEKFPKKLRVPSGGLAVKTPRRKNGSHLRTARWKNAADILKERGIQNRERTRPISGPHRGSGPVRGRRRGGRQSTRALWRAAVAGNCVYVSARDSMRWMLFASNFGSLNSDAQTLAMSR
jgi:hypothetical protein